MPITLPDLAKTISRFCLGEISTESVGIDIGCHGVTVANVSYGTKKKAKQRSDEDAASPRPTNPSRRFIWESRAANHFTSPLVKSLDEGEAPTTKSVINALEHHLPRQIDGGPRPVNVALPPAATILRWPLQEQISDLARTIRNDLGNSLLPGDTIESCGWPIGKSGRKMIYAVSGGMTRAIAESLVHHGFRTPRVDSRPHVLARALQLDAIGDSRIIIDWSWHDCTLLISTAAAEQTSGSASQPQQPAWATPELCRPLHGYCLAANQRMGASPVSQNRNRRGEELQRQHMLPLFRAAAEEIQRTLRFAEALQGVNTTGPIVICGPAAIIPDATNLLSESLEREVRSWRWGGVKRPTSNSPETDDSLFAVAIAAACGMLA